MLTILLAVLIAVNAAWSVGTVLPECCSLAARCAAFVVGGAIGSALFLAWDATVWSLIAALFGSFVAGSAAAWFVTRGTARLMRVRAALQRG